MKNILVAVDFEKGINPILTQALSMAKAYQAKLWIVHVVTPVKSQIGYNLSTQSIPGLMAAGEGYYSQLFNLDTTRKMIATELHNEHNKLLEYCDKIKAENIEVQGLLIQGDPAEVIIMESKKKEIDVIILGTHGHGLFHKTIMGSTSEQVIHQSSKPTLLIPIDKEI